MRVTLYGFMEAERLLGFRFQEISDCGRVLKWGAIRKNVIRKPQRRRRLNRKIRFRWNPLDILTVSFSLPDNTRYYAHTHIQTRSRVKYVFRVIE